MKVGVKIFTTFSINIIVHMKDIYKVVQRKNKEQKNIGDTGAHKVILN